MNIREALAEDAAAMSALLNAIIATGGTTAHTRPFDADRMRAHYINRPTRISCLVAEDAASGEDSGPILGFQFLAWPEDQDEVPDGWAIIATFVGEAAQGRGVGRALFAATKDRARAAGVQSIDATIRTDNKPGLAYYRKIGFSDYGLRRGVELSDGSVVDQVRRRLDLAPAPA